MHLNPALGLPEFCPPEKAQTQINGSRVKSIESTLNFKLSGKSFLLSNVNHLISKSFENTIVPILVRLRKIAPGYSGFSKAKVIRFSTMRIENADEFPKTIATSKLTKHHHKKMIPASERLHIFIALVFQNYSLKKLLREEFNQLGKYILSCVHTFEIMLDFKSIHSNRGHGKYAVYNI
jgi:hypothetical protein